MPDADPSNADDVKAQSNAKMYSIFAPKAPKLSTSSVASQPPPSVAGPSTTPALAANSSKSMHGDVMSDEDDLVLVPTQSSTSSSSTNGKLKPRKHGTGTARTSSRLSNVKSSQDYYSAASSQATLLSSDSETELTIDSDDNDEQDDADDFEIISSKSPVRKTKRKSKIKEDVTPKRKKKKSAQASNIIVIDDSPVRAVFPKGFASLHDTYRERKQKAEKYQAPRERWPTADEHLPSQPVATQLSPFERAVRWSQEKGKGKAIQNDDVSLSDLWRPPTGKQAPSTFPKPVSISLDDLDEYVPRRASEHPLLSRLAQSAKSNHGAARPNVASFAAGPAELWTVKYSPRSADEILGLRNSQNARILRDWLKEVGVNEDRVNKKATGSSGKKRKSRVIERKVDKQKKKQARTLDGWIVESDEEDEEEDAPFVEDALLDDVDESDTHLLSDQSAPAGKSPSLPSLTNVILLVGPSGSGRTAAVQAIAHELDWDVFEVNAGGGKRAPANIERLVGDVGRNHIVHGAGSPSKSKNPFAFAAAAAAKKQANGTSSPAPLPQQQEIKESRQSLILIEEVDVLFKDESNPSWYSGLDSFVENSRRPIVMTCNYDTAVEYDKLPFQHIKWAPGASDENLLFEAVTEADAIDYLRLVALSEGHILPDERAKEIYADTARSDRATPWWYVNSGLAERPAHEYATSTSAPDLRQATMQLQFECQYGLGPGEWHLHEIGSKAAAWYALWPNMPTRNEDTSLGSARTSETESFIDACLDSARLRLETFEGGPTFERGDDEVTFEVLPHPFHPREPRLLGEWELVQSMQETVRQLAGVEGDGSLRAQSVFDAQSRHYALAAPLATSVLRASLLLPQSYVRTDYLPAIRAITEAERLRLIAGEDEDVGGRRLRRTTRASAYEPLLRWQEDEADLIAQTGFGDKLAPSQNEGGQEQKTES